MVWDVSNDGTYSNLHVGEITVQRVTGYVQCSSSIVPSAVEFRILLEDELVPCEPILVLRVGGGLLLLFLHRGL